MARLWLKVFLGWLLLTLPTWALTDEQKRLLGRVSEYYRFVHQDNLATWLEGQVNSDKVVFGKFTGDKAATIAAVDMLTKTITVNETMFTRDDFASLLDMGNTLAHERRHSNQSYLGWGLETYKQDLGHGNAYERDGWAEGFRVARATALKLQEDLTKATSARQREIAGQRLKIAVESWQTMANDWAGESKQYGSFAPGEFTDSDGLPLSLEDMAAERKALLGAARDAVVTSKALTTTYSGLYRGQLSGGASGSFAFQVQSDYSVSGQISGTHQYGNYKGTLHGRVDQDGLVSGQIRGTISDDSWSESFTGTFSGRISGNSASGKWTAGADDVWPSGTWSVNKP